VGVRLYAALVHHPVRDRAGALVTSAITNVDVHDLARSCRTYGLRGYFVVSPIAAQRALIERILEHWRTGAGARRIPERTEALALCVPCSSVEDALAAIEAREGASPRLVVTSARDEGRPVISYRVLAEELAAGAGPVLLAFGTGHGLHRTLVARADAVLAPIRPRGYNHLSVRAAAAITLDRLFGDG
jgi:hypothetical protein